MTPPDTQSPDFSGPPTVVIIARIARLGYKGHQELIACWSRVRSAVSNASMVVVGGGPGRDDIRAAAQQSPAASAIEMKGFVPEAEIETIWRRTHVLAMPSRGEGFGLVYIEAMRRSIHVIASLHDAAQEINLDGLTGFNVDLRRKDELPDRIVQLLRDPPSCEAWQEWTRPLATKFSVQCIRTVSAATIGSADGASGQRESPLLEVKA